MKYTTTTDAPIVPVVEPADELTQAELERIIRLAREVKRKAIGRLTVDAHANNGGLYIVGWKRAA